MKDLHFVVKQTINNHRLALWETVIYLYFMDERGLLKQIEQKQKKKSRPIC